MSDFRWQQEMQEERMTECLSMLTRIQDRCGVETALKVAVEFGMLKEWKQFNRKEKVYGKDQRNDRVQVSEAV